MEVINTTRVLLLVAISSFILGTFSSEASDISPSAAPVSSISTSPSSSPASSPSSQIGEKDIPDNIKQFITTGIDAADKGIKEAQKLLEDPSTDPAVNMCLNQCVESLGYAIDDFNKALDSVAANDNYLLSEDLDAALTDASSCDGCFEEMVGGNNPVAEFYKAIKVATSHCQSILDYTS